MHTESVVIKTRRQLGDAAKAYNWARVLDILGHHGHLVDSTRPGGQSLYTPLHQAAHGGAPVEVVERLLALGASTTQQNAQGQKAVDIARENGHQHLVRLLEPGEPLPLRFPGDVDEAQSVCALGFLGYEYESSIGIPLSKMIEPIVKERMLYEEQNRNFAAFFGLQRYLCKWGGEYLSKYADEHLAYDFLFLHLYRLEPEECFRHQDYYDQWRNEFAPWAESIAGYVRRSLRRIGAGKTLLI